MAYKRFETFDKLYDSEDNESLKDLAGAYYLLNSSYVVWQNADDLKDDDIKNEENPLQYLEIEVSKDFK
jgi:hypothetical protein